MTKNRPKNGSLNRDLLNFLYRYGIFWMPPGESSHPGGSEYVWQGGLEDVSLRAELGAAEVYPNFQKKERICGVQKNKHGRNFQNIASKTNQRWLITCEKPLI